MRSTLTLDMDGDAAPSNPTAEPVRIRDENGNAVGRWPITATADSAVEPLTFPFPVVVNVWDAALYGDGAESGTRWAVYEDDPEQGYLTHTAHARGALPESMMSLWDAEDDWYGGDAARDFLAALARAGVRA